METTNDNTNQGILSTDDQIRDVETENEAPKKRPSELAVEEGKVSIKKQELEAVEPKAASSEEPASATQDTGSSSSGETKKRESSSRDVNDSDDKPFGGRILTDESLVFDQNAWDHAPWGEEQEQHAKKEISRQQQDPVPEEMVQVYHAEAAENWNKFYAKNENRFFKDRHWLRIEFPELFQMVEADAGAKTVLEIGCGAGNTMFPMLLESKNPELFVYGCDFSSTAVEVVRSNPNYDEKRCKAFVWDLGGDDIPPEVQPESMDVLVLIFVLSALHPDKWDQAMNNLYKLLKPGGLIVFRDYGRYDMTQLRFKKNRLLSDNFYVRGDGTRVYYFDSDEIVRLFGSKFTIEQNAIDRRLIVNRLRKVKMYRVWLQGKFRKPLAGQAPGAPSATTVITNDEPEGGEEEDVSVGPKD
ncbi:MAG: S-adenosyl-L-methionine-dependent methyltransferase, partial [Benniella sp.]